MMHLYYRFLIYLVLLGNIFVNSQEIQECTQGKRLEQRWLKVNTHTAKCSTSHLSDDMITDRAFHNADSSSPNNLIILDLHNNKLTSINEKWFSHLANLKMLFLSENRLESIDHEPFANLVKLTQLHLQGNRISSFSVKLDNLQHLMQLDISDNEITQLDRNIFGRFASKDVLGDERRSLYLSENRLICKCPIFAAADGIKVDNLIIHGEGQTCVMLERLEPFPLSCLVSLDANQCKLKSKQKDNLVMQCQGGNIVNRNKKYMGSNYIAIFLSVFLLIGILAISFAGIYYKYRKKPTKKVVAATESGYVVDLANRISTAMTKSTTDTDTLVNKKSVIAPSEAGYDGGIYSAVNNAWTYIW